MKTPVVFIIFRRPELTKRVFAAIRAAAPERLFVIADGPRPLRLGEAELCEITREVVERGVDWPCEVTRIYSGKNMGCADRVSSGLTAVFAEVEEAIILEDDCLPDATFFPFCEQLLARYRNEERVALIAGCSFQSLGPFRGRTGYFFSRFPHCWGWATWRRSWQYYRHDLSEAMTEDFPFPGKELLCPTERRYWDQDIRAAVTGKLDSWANRWAYSVFQRQGVCVLPYPNLISNIGFGEESTHTVAVNHPVASMPLEPQAFPMKEPPVMAVDTVADNVTQRVLYIRYRWDMWILVRLWRGVRKMLRLAMGHQRLKPTHRA